jgi:hypothetical protein
MGYTIATVDNSGGTLAYHKVLAAIKTLAEANGWVTQRYVDTGDDRELLLKGEGLTGTEEIFIGFKCYHSVPGDYYNLACATMVGYIPANTFEAQPGIRISGVPCHNNAVTMFMTANAQRITGCFKVGTPVYTHFYEGKFFPYCRPGEFPTPLISAGMFNGAAAIRFSDITYQFPYKGLSTALNHLYMRNQAGSWIQPRTWPWSDQRGTGTNGFYIAGPHTSTTARCLVAYNGQYTPLPVVLEDDVPNVWGELDGIFFISGFNNGVENVLQIGGDSVVDQTGMTPLQAVDAVRAVNGRAFVVLQDVTRTSWRDFIAMEMM